VERRGRFSADLPNPHGGTVLAGYDARTGERWHSPASLTLGPESD
jgi:hypothetical protein